MSSGRKCKNCGSSDIEVDPARGDAVCTNCGSVLEDNIIVAEVQFEEGAHGTGTAIGQFVSADSKGGATKFGASFHVGVGLESREITLRKARNGITQLCNQLRLNQHCIDTACRFFNMALCRNLTRGRRNSHVHAACVYLTCRTEGTPHLLIDISDVLQICCYELGRAYLKLSKALCINIPSVDPCMYILRFAGQLEFGSKTQQVANTALRLVQRMKRDSIHSGRRPSGLCGAALLIAARLHEFSRSTSDIVKIVKVHESTLRKRLIEFGDTPSSALTLEEFMTVDLEEEQDPPSFKAARKKDKERLQKLMEEEADCITDLQRQIESQLEKDNHKKTNQRNSIEMFLSGNGNADESAETEKFINECTLGTIRKIMDEENVDDPENDVEDSIKELGPDIASMGLANSLSDTSNALQPAPSIEVDLTSFEELDDAELDSYIMSDHEAECKKVLWHERNAAYLEQQKSRAEKLQKEREEGKTSKRKRKVVVRKKATSGPASSASEAIEKILQEKKISTKINYEVLKTLNATSTSTNIGGGLNAGETADNSLQEQDSSTTSESIKRRRLSSTSSFLEHNLLTDNKLKKTKLKVTPNIGLPVVESKKPLQDESDEIKKRENVNTATLSEEELEEDYEDEEGAGNDDTVAEEMGVVHMLRQHHRQGDEDENEMDHYGYDYDEDY